MYKKKVHYKMYKSGKRWMVMGLATFSVLAGGAFATQAHADTVNHSTSNATSTLVSSASDTSTVSSAGTTTPTSTTSNTTTSSNVTTNVNATTSITSDSVKSDTSATDSNINSVAPSSLASSNVVSNTSSNASSNASTTSNSSTSDANSNATSTTLSVSSSNDSASSNSNLDSASSSASLNAQLAAVFATTTPASDGLSFRDGDSIAAGTWGTANWNLANDGTLTLANGDLQTPAHPQALNNVASQVTHIVTQNVVAPVFAGGLFAANKNGDFNQTFGNYATNSHPSGDGFVNLQSIDVSGLDTSKTTNMNRMFDTDDNLTTVYGLNHMDTSKVTDMRFMFIGAKIQYLDLSNFDMRSLNTDTPMISQVDANGNVTYVEDSPGLYGHDPQVGLFGGTKMGTVKAGPNTNILSSDLFNNSGDPLVDQNGNAITNNDQLVAAGRSANPTLYSKSVHDSLSGLISNIQQLQTSFAARYNNDAGVSAGASNAASAAETGIGIDPTTYASYSNAFDSAATAQTLSAQYNMYNNVTLPYADNSYDSEIANGVAYLNNSGAAQMGSLAQTQYNQFKDKAITTVLSAGSVINVMSSLANSYNATQATNSDRMANNFNYIGQIRSAYSAGSSAYADGSTFLSEAEQTIANGRALVDANAQASAAAAAAASNALASAQSSASNALISLANSAAADKSSAVNNQSSADSASANNALNSQANSLNNSAAIDKSNAINNQSNADSQSASNALNNQSANDSQSASSALSSAQNSAAIDKSSAVSSQSSVDSASADSRANSLSNSAVIDKSSAVSSQSSVDSSSADSRANSLASSAASDKSSAVSSQSSVDSSSADSRATSLNSSANSHIASQSATDSNSAQIQYGSLSSSATSAQKSAVNSQSLSDASSAANDKQYALMEQSANDSAQLNYAVSVALVGAKSSADGALTSQANELNSSATAQQQSDNNEIQALNDKLHQPKPKAPKTHVTPTKINQNTTIDIHGRKVKLHVKDAPILMVEHKDVNGNQVKLSGRYLGKKFTATLHKRNISNAYYQTIGNKIAIAKQAIREYKNADFSQATTKVNKKHTRLHIKAIVKSHGVTRLQLTNGNFVTANKYLVSIK